MERRSRYVTVVDCQRLNCIKFLNSQVKIWDTAGSEKYMSISAVYYRKADGVIFLFDVTKPRSFTDVETIWMNAVDAPDRWVM